MINQKHFKDDLIILKKFSINENHLLINAFGKFSGKIQIKAKGAKKILSKFTGRLEVFSLITASIYNSGSSLTLTDASLKKAPLLNSSLDYFNINQNICYLLNRFLPFQEQNIYLFEIIEHLIHNDQNLFDTYYKIEIFFLLKFLDSSGQLPNLSTCNKCNTKFTSSPALADTVFLCNQCCTEHNNFSLHLNTLKLLNYISHCPNVQSLKPVKIPNTIYSEAKEVLNNLIRFSNI